MDSGGRWTDAVAAAYGRFRERRMLFEGAHEAYFVTGSGERQLFKYEVRNWLGDRLSKRIAELVFPGFPRIYAVNRRDQPVVDRLIRELRLVELAYPTALMVSWAGNATWKVYLSPAVGGPAVRLWGTEEGEFAWWDFVPGDRAAPYAVNFWFTVERGGRTYRVNERHAWVGWRPGVLEQTVRAWEVGREDQDPVPLEEAWPSGVMMPLERVVRERVRHLPGYCIPNVDLFGHVMGDSDYSEGLVQIQRRVNRVAAQRALVCDLTGLPQFRVPRSLVRPDGTIDLRNVWLQIEYEGESDTPIRIENWEGNMANTLEELQQLNEEFIRGSILSKALDGEAQGGGESGYARRLSLVKMEAGIYRRRSVYDGAFEWVMRCAQEAAGQRRLVGPLSVLWPSPIPEDPEAVARMVNMARAEGVMSLERAVRLLNPMECNEWVSEEVARILEERGQAART